MVFYYTGILVPICITLEQLGESHVLGNAEHPHDKMLTLADKFKNVKSKEKFIFFYLYWKLLNYYHQILTVLTYNMNILYYNYNTSY